MTVLMSEFRPEKEDEINNMERPKIEEFFGDAGLSDVCKSYLDSPNLFKYAQALDKYIDYLHENKCVLFNVTDSTKRPPIGIKPKYVWKEERKRELLQAIIRYGEASKQVPEKWIKEFNEYCR